MGLLLVGIPVVTKGVEQFCVGQIVTLFFSSFLLPFLCRTCIVVNIARNINLMNSLRFVKSIHLLVFVVCIESSFQ